MTRGARRAGGLLAATLLGLASVPSHAAGEPAILKADPGVRVGRANDWRPATAGVTVGPADLLDVPAGARVTVRLGDGTEQVVEGRTVLSGRRLTTDKSAAGRLVFFNKTFQQAAGEIVVEVEETGSTALAVRSSQVGRDDGRKLGGGRSVTFLGDDEREAPPRSSAADFAESYFRRGEWQLAADAAWLAIRSPESTPLEQRRGHLVLARLATNEGQHELALRDLHAACRLSGPVEPGGRAFVAAALVARGQAWLALGEDAKAMEDFRSALDHDAGGAAGAQANFFLGAIALSQQDVDTARELFGRLKGYPELSQAGADLLAAAQN